MGNEDAAVVKPTMVADSGVPAGPGMAKLQSEADQILLAKEFHSDLKVASNFELPESTMNGDLRLAYILREYMAIAMRGVWKGVWKCVKVFRREVFGALLEVDYEIIAEQV